jgi:single-stranded-DNA-specific exonuclease
MCREAAALVRREKLNQRPVMVLAKEGWHPGVLGIVAARLAEEHHRPVAMVSLKNGTGRGSARSVEGFHLFKGLQACEAVLKRYGGHAAAAGFEVASDQIAALQEKLEQALHSQVGPEPPRPTLKVDAQVQLGELNREFFSCLERLRPFGPGNPAPVFVCREVECLSSRVVAERHLKVQLCQQNCVPMEAIAFDQAAHHPLAGELEVAFSARLSHYQGRAIPELMLLDWGKP